MANGERLYISYTKSRDSMFKAVSFARRTLVTIPAPELTKRSTLKLAYRRRKSQKCLARSRQSWWINSRPNGTMSTLGAKTTCLPWQKTTSRCIQRCCCCFFCHISVVVDIVVDDDVFMMLLWRSCFDVTLTSLFVDPLVMPILHRISSNHSLL